MRNRQYLIPWLAAGLLLAACGASGAEQAEAARAAYAAMDYPAARDRLAEALADAPGDPELLLLLARTRLELGDGEGVIGTLDRLAAIDSLPPDAALLYAEAELQRGEIAKGLARIEDDVTADGWRLRAWAAMQQGDRAGAAQAFTSGLAAPGPKARFNSDYAIFLVDDGRIAEARAAADEARAEAPDLVQPLIADGLVAQAERRGEAALAAYNAILDRMPHHPVALRGAIDVLGQAGRIDELTPLVERGRQARPGDPEFIFLAARIAAESGDWAAARDILQAGEGAIADHLNARGLYAQAMLETGQREDALRRLIVLHRQMPEHDELRRLYARALGEVGDWGEALRIIRPLAERENARPEDLAFDRRAAQGAGDNGPAAVGAAGA